jgi:hypothetical protein
MDLVYLLKIGRQELDCQKIDRRSTQIGSICRPLRSSAIGGSGAADLIRDDLNRSS